VKKLGIIGCGAIGSVVAYAVDRGEVKAELAALYDIVVEKCLDLSNKLLASKPLVCKSLDCLLSAKPDLVVEAASQEAVREYVPGILEQGISVVVLSVGALLDRDLYDKLLGICRSKGSRIYIPTGAVAGIDAIKAASLSGVKRIVLTTRKSPKSISSESLRKLGFNEEIREPTVIYEGTAEEAVKALPFNINVAATLRIASRAPVVVRVIADPSVTRNVHEILVESEASNLRIVVENRPHPENPKTSYIAALSAVQLLKQILEPGINIGT